MEDYIFIQDGDQAQVSESIQDGDQAQESESIQDGDQAQESESIQDGDQAQVIDYSTYLEDLNDKFDILNTSIVDIQEDVSICRDNGYRQYYFIGGLYVVFFIIIAIKFFKQFF